MSYEQIAVFAILAGMLVLFAWDRLRYDMVAIVALLAAVVAGVVDPNDAFRGFSDDIVIIVGSALVVSAAIGRSGVTETLIRPLAPYMRTTEIQIIVLCTALAVLSAFIKNIGSLAIFSPMAFPIARRTGTPVARLLMPMSFAALLGGMMTLIGTSPNIVVARIRAELVGEPFRMFDYFPVAAILTVLGIVRRPDPVPCIPCGIGEWDMCSNGLYTERGIKGRHGYASERFRIEPEFAVKVAPALGRLSVLLEPASVLAKAWDHIRRIGGRAAWAPQRVLITGAGPVGLLAALMGAQQGFEVHVFDRNQTGSKPDLVRALGETYHTDLASVGFAPDIVLECTGATSVVLKVMTLTAPGGIVCLTGAPTKERIVTLDLGQFSRGMVIENSVIFGSVNANRTHFELAADALGRAGPDWLERLISRRVPLADWRQAPQRRKGEVKLVLDFKA